MEQMDKLGADLVKAAEHGTPEQVKRLLEAGAPVDTTGPTGVRTAAPTCSVPPGRTSGRHRPVGVPFEGREPVCRS